MVADSVACAVACLAQSWEGLNCSLQRACFAAPDTYMRLEVWNNDVNGFHDLLGTVETSMADLLKLCEQGPVNYQLQTKNIDPAAIVGPTPPMAGKARAKKSTKNCVLRVRVRLPTSNGQAAAVAAAEASSPTLAYHGARERQARGGVRRKKQPQAYAEDLAFLQALMKEEVVEESDMKAIVGDGIRYLCERIEKPGDKLSGTSSTSGDGRVEYRHTRRTKAERAGKQSAQVPSYGRASGRLPAARARPVSLPALSRPQDSDNWGQDSVELARRSDGVLLPGIRRRGNGDNTRKNFRCGRYLLCAFAPVIESICDVYIGRSRKYRPTGPQSDRRLRSERRGGGASSTTGRNSLENVSSL